MLAVLAVGEIASTTTLLVGAGLLIRSLYELRHVDPGFAAASVLTARVDLPETRYSDPRRSASLADELLSRIRAEPIVAAAGAIHTLPIAGISSVRPYAVAGHTPSQDEPMAQYRIVTPGYFDALGIPVVTGRDFGERDGADAPLAIIVSESLARQIWRDGRAVGERMTFAGAPDLWGQVVGVVGDVRHHGLDRPPSPTMYWPAAQVERTESRTLARGLRTMTLVVKTSGATAAAVDSVRRQLAAVDPTVALRDVRTMDSIVRGSFAQRGFTTVLAITLSALALALAVVGVYGVLSYLVGRRTHEFAVRTALGARPREVMALAARRGILLVSAGLVMGLVGGLAASRLMGNLLFGVGAGDPATFVAVSLLIAVVGLLACSVPAIRAARGEPSHALRAD
jgi:predicted permease